MDLDPNAAVTMNTRSVVYSNVDKAMFDATRNATSDGAHWADLYQIDAPVSDATDSVTGANMNAAMAAVVARVLPW